MQDFLGKLQPRRMRDDLAEFHSEKIAEPGRPRRE